MKFMKKTVFCVALVAALFLAVPANAQFKFGPKVGMNISTLFFLSVEICLIISRQIIFRALREV